MPYSRKPKPYRSFPILKDSSSSQCDRSLLQLLDADLRTVNTTSNPERNSIRNGVSSQSSNRKRPQDQDKSDIPEKKWKRRPNSTKALNHIRLPSVSSSVMRTSSTDTDASTIHRHPSSTSSPTLRYTSSVNSSSPPQRYSPSAASTLHCSSSSAASTSHRSSTLVSSSVPRYLSTSSHIKQQQNSYTTAYPAHQGNSLSEQTHSVYQGDYTDDSGYFKRTEPSSPPQSTSIPCLATTSTINNYILPSKTKNYIDLTTTGYPDDSIEAYLKHTKPSSPPQSTLTPRFASTPTINNYIPTSKTENYIDLTTTGYPDDSIEAYLKHTKPSSPPQSTLIPRFASTPTINNYIPTSKTESYIDLMTTTQPPLALEESRESVITRMEGERHNDEALKTMPNQSYTPPKGNDTAMEIVTEVTSAASVNQFYDAPIEQQFEQKMDDDNNSSVKIAPRPPLGFDELFSTRSYKSEPKAKQKPAQQRRKRGPNKVKSLSDSLKSLGLSELMINIGTCLTEEETDLDKEQELGFFSDETPKDNGQESTSEQDLANGFDGFSDTDD